MNDNPNTPFAGVAGVSDSLTPPTMPFAATMAQWAKYYMDNSQYQMALAGTSASSPGFSLNGPIGANYRADPGDIMNTKRALSQLGYYDIAAHRDDGGDGAMFDAVRRFQQDNGLTVDAFMRPDGPTANAIDQGLQRASFGSPLFLDGNDGGPVAYTTYQCTPCAKPPVCGQNPCVKT